jgi:predicted membrane protein (TIGR00267 family)
MGWRAYLEGSRGRLDIVAGLVDGILNALTLAAGRILNSNKGADFDLAIRLAIATGLTTIFVFFIAHYAELRAELTRAERELNLLSHGRLATSRLGQRALQSAAGSALLAGACGIIGATLSLLLCVYIPGPRWVGLAAILILLGTLGAFLARSFHGSPLIWSCSVAICGALLTFVGMKISIVN